MKLSFATLGCPKWDLDRIVSAASELGYDGIDFRGYLGQLKIYELDEFKNGLDETVGKIRMAGLAVSGFSSSVTASCADEAGRKDFSNEIREYARLCRIFGTRYIRIFGGKIGERTRFEALKTARPFLRELAKIAEDNDVEILIETHDDWIASDDFLQLLECAESPRIGALWDVHHPYRFKGEPPAETWNKVGKYVRNTHWKDSRTFKNPDGGNGFKPCLCGDGDVPYAEILSVLRSGGYDGWLTYEWEKQWHPEIEEPETAFPNFIKTMRKLGA